jgi:LPXTG-motif cell wall-anchored protein
MRMELRGKMWDAAACALVILAMTAGAALAAAPGTTAYHFSSHPMISGTVVTVNDREMVVNTDQGEQVTLALDSHTMAPRDLAPGMVMRAEFVALEDCRFYAQRVMPIRSGMSTNRLQAYANTHDSGETIARNTTGFGDYRSANSESQVRSGSRETQTQTMGEHSPGASMTASPGTADYQFSTQPMISGGVVTVNDHLLVVETDQGQRIGLVMDSQTMVPAEVAPGTVFRAEFKQMKDGRYYAKRILWVANGVVGREQAYAHTRDSDLALARNTTDCGCVNTASPNTTTSALERRDIVVRPEAVVAEQVPEPVVQRPETLPQTASNEPLIALLALLALGSAGALAFARRRHAV